MTGSIEALAEIRDRIARQVEPGPGLSLVETPLQGVRLAFSATATEPTRDVAAPALAIVAQGAKRTELRDRTYRYRAGQFLVAGVELPVTGQITEADAAEPFLAFVLELEPAEIAGLLLQSEGRPRIPEGAGEAMAVGDASPELLDATTRLLALIERPSDRAALAPLYRREILWRLLSGEQGAIVRRIGLSDSRLSQVARAICWIRANYAEPLSVEDLAEISSMSVSSFHRHFRAVTRTTPVQFQKQLRLQQARSLLSAAPDDVAGAGFAVGYGSPSQFSREYRRMFGLPPGRDGARLREATISPT